MTTWIYVGPSESAPGGLRFREVLDAQDPYGNHLGPFGQVGQNANGARLQPGDVFLDPFQQVPCFKGQRKVRV